MAKITREWAFDPISVSDKGIPTARGFKMYDWPCPYCGDTAHESDNNQSGEEMDCRQCGKPLVLGDAE